MQILIADDDYLARRITERALIKWGYEVLSVSDGHEALQVLRRSSSPRMALLDWEMPGMNGVEVIREVRAMEKQAYVYMVLLTGKGKKNEVVQGLEAGADDYIVKPFELGELRARIRCGQRIVEFQSGMNEGQAGQDNSRPSPFQGER